MAEQQTNNGYVRNALATLVAVAAFIVFVGLVVAMLFDICAEEKVWMRRTYLLKGVEAIAFAGAGFLFGKEVHRIRAEKAEQRAEKAEQTANEATRQAVKSQSNGKALAMALKTKAESQQSPPETTEELGKKELNDLAIIASKLFPVDTTDTT